MREKIQMANKMFSFLSKNQKKKSELNRWTILFSPIQLLIQIFLPILVNVN